MNSKDDLLEPASDSFWEIDSYKRVVKRTEDGFHACNELMKLIQERSEIELKYATKLQAWNKKWNESIEKSTEYGTGKSILLSSLDESESLATVHTAMKNNLLELQNEIKKWRNETYKKQVVGICKEAKQFEEEFRKAQKPWAKHLSKFQKYKKEYQASLKNERISENLLTAVSGSEEQEKKLSEKLEKAKREVEHYEEKLNSAHKELNSYKPIYVEEMIDVFQKCQDFEEKRLSYFKEALVTMHGCLDVSQNDQIPLIFLHWRKNLEVSNPKKDLKWWSEKYGADMGMRWPSLHDNSDNETSSQKSKEESPKPITRKLAETNLTSSTNPQRQISYDKKLNPFGSCDDEPKTPQTIISHPDVVSNVINYDPDLNPFGEAKDDDDDDDVSFNSEKKSISSINKGATVVALYDYTGQEDDELTFKKGNQFEKLKDKDDQGWCTGIIDGRVGLYPENFVKLVD